MRATGVRGAIVSGRTETDRLLVMLARFVAAGFGVYFLISLPTFGQPPGLVADWFAPVAAVAAFVPAALMMFATFRVRSAALHPVFAYLCGVGYLAASGCWFLAWGGETTEVEQVSWLINFAGLPALALALYRLRDAALMLIACSLARAAIIEAARGAGLEVLWQEALWSIAFTAPFVVAFRMVIRVGRLLDQTRATTAIRAAAEAAGAAARNAERSRFDALIHDQVIATLLAAKSREPDQRLAEQARSALHELALIADDGPDSADAELSIAETVARLRTLATSIEADASLGVVNKEGLDEAVPRYPEYAVRAMAEAMGEGLRNSVMHAGADAERAILVEAGPDWILLTVADNGDGFDLDEVPPERLGIEVSIRARLEGIPGGSAALGSVRGKGTTVRLRWSRQ